MKLSQYAKMKGVVYRTAWNWWRAGIIECDQDPITKSILLDEIDGYNRLTAFGTEKLLIKYPRLAEKCNLFKLNENNWKRILFFQPELINYKTI